MPNALEITRDKRYLFSFEYQDFKAVVLKKSSEIGVKVFVFLNDVFQQSTDLTSFTKVDFTCITTAVRIVGMIVETAEENIPEYYEVMKFTPQYCGWLEDDTGLDVTLMCNHAKAGDYHDFMRFYTPRGHREFIATPNRIYRIEPEQRSEEVLYFQPYHTIDLTKLAVVWNTDRNDLGFANWLQDKGYGTIHDIEATFRIDHS